MGLVDYSDSESDSEPVAKPAAERTSTAQATAKKPIHKVVDRSNPRKIVVNLGVAAEPDEKKHVNNSDEPPAKRVRTSGGAFSGFNSLLPPPKNTGKSTTGSSSSGKSASKPVGVMLKTSSEPGFSRTVSRDDSMTNGQEHDRSDSTSAGHAASEQPSVPAGQKPPSEVKLVGTPLMFKPLSVSRKQGKKTVARVSAAPKAVAPSAAAPTRTPAEADIANNVSEPKEKKKVSLFTFSNAEETPEDAGAEPASNNGGAYESMFAPDEPRTQADDFADYDAQHASTYATSQQRQQQPASSLFDIASEMNLSATARRELFGRRGAPTPLQSAARVVNFNTDQEYLHNEEIRAAGEQQVHNPVRAIAPGKHSLQQLVNHSRNQQPALEESFAAGKNNRSEAGAKYGWR